MSTIADVNHGNIKKNESTYWKCALFRTGCSARITTVDKQLVSPIPAHSHKVQHAENTVHIAKQTLKRTAAETDLPSKCGYSTQTRRSFLWGMTNNVCAMESLNTG